MDTLNEIQVYYDSHSNDGCYYVSPETLQVRFSSKDVKTLKLYYFDYAQLSKSSTVKCILASTEDENAFLIPQDEANTFGLLFEGGRNFNTLSLDCTLNMEGLDLVINIKSKKYLEASSSDGLEPCRILDFLQYGICANYNYWNKVIERDLEQGKTYSLVYGKTNKPVVLYRTKTLYKPGLYCSEDNFTFVDELIREDDISKYGISVIGPVIEQLFRAMLLRQEYRKDCEAFMRLDAIQGSINIQDTSISLKRCSVGDTSAFLQKLNTSFELNDELNVELFNAIAVVIKSGIFRVWSCTPDSFLVTYNSVKNPAFSHIDKNLWGPVIETLIEWNIQQVTGSCTQNPSKIYWKYLHRWD